MSLHRVPQPVFYNEFADVAIVPLSMIDVMRIRHRILGSMQGRYPNILPALRWQPVSREVDQPLVTQHTMLSQDEIYLAARRIKDWAADRRDRQLKALHSTAMVQRMSHVRRVLEESTSFVSYDTAMQLPELGQLDLGSDVVNRLAAVLTRLRAVSPFLVMPPTWAMRMSAVLTSEQELTGDDDDDGMNWLTFGTTHVTHFWTPELLKEVDDLLYRLSLFSLVLNADLLDSSTISSSRADASAQDVADKDIINAHRFYTMLISIQAGWWAALNGPLASAFLSDTFFVPLEKLFEKDGVKVRNKGSAFLATRDWLSRLGRFTPEMREIANCFNGAGVSGSNLMVSNQVNPPRSDEGDVAPASSHVPVAFVLPSEFISQKELSEASFFDIIRHSMSAHTRVNPVAFASKMLGVKSNVVRDVVYGPRGWVLLLNQWFHDSIPNLERAAGWSEAYASISEKADVSGGGTLVPFYRGATEAVAVSRFTNDSGIGSLLPLLTRPVLSQRQSWKRMSTGRILLTAIKDASIPVAVPHDVTRHLGAQGLQPEIWRLTTSAQSMGEATWSLGSTWLDFALHFGKALTPSQGVASVLYDLLFTQVAAFRALSGEDLPADMSPPVTVVLINGGSLDPQAWARLRVEDPSFSACFDAEGNVLAGGGRKKASTPVMSLQEFLSYSRAELGEKGYALEGPQRPRLFDFVIYLNEETSSPGILADQGDGVPFYRTTGISNATAARWSSDGLSLYQQEEADTPNVIDQRRTSALVLMNRTIILRGKDLAGSVVSVMAQAPQALDFYQPHQGSVDVVEDGFVWKHLVLPSLYKGYAILLNTATAGTVVGIVADGGEYEIGPTVPTLDTAHVGSILAYARELAARANITAGRSRIKGSIL